MNSKFLNLNLSDFGKGLILAVLTAAIGFVYALIKDKGFDISSADLNDLLKIVITAFLGYLSKNLLTNSEGEVFRGEK